MGWMMVWGGKTFFVSMPSSVITMIIIGGVLYSIGVVFYLMEKWKWPLCGSIANCILKFPF